MMFRAIRKEFTEKGIFEMGSLAKREWWGKRFYVGETAYTKAQC